MENDLFTDTGSTKDRENYQGKKLLIIEKQDAKEKFLENMPVALENALTHSQEYVKEYEGMRKLGEKLSKEQQDEYRCCWWFGFISLYFTRMVQGENLFSLLNEMSSNCDDKDLWDYRGLLDAYYCLGPNSLPNLSSPKVTKMRNFFAYKVMEQMVKKI